ncbi:MAG: hypothetical protein K6L73_05815 [Cellvibrionaceae bacterium]
MNLSRRFLSLLSRFVWQLTVVFFIVVAVVVALGRELAPLADSYRPTILSIVNEIIGVPLDAHQVGVRWKGIIPAIEVKNATVLGLDGERSLTLGQLVVDINPWLSLWHWKPVLYRLQIIEPQVYLEKDDNKQWQLSGIPRKAEGNKVSLKSVMDAMLYSHLVELRDAHFVFQSKSGVSRRVFTPRIGIDNMKNFHRLTAVVGFEQAGSVEVLLEGRGDHNREGGMALSGYFKSESLDVAVLSRMLGYEWHSERSSIIDLSLWMESPNSNEIEIKGQVNLDHFSGVKDKLGRQIIPALNSFSAQLNGLGRYEEGWRISLNNIAGDLGGEAFPVDQLAFRGSWGGLLMSDTTSYEKKGQKPEVSIGFGDFQASDILSMKLFKNFLPEKTQKILQEMSPDAQVANAWVDVFDDSESPIFFRGNFFNAEVKPWKGVPQVARSHGYFEVEKLTGRVVLNSQDGFDITFPKIFDSSSGYSEVNGELRWSIYPEENYFTLYSGPVTLKGEAGIIAGDFALYEAINRKVEGAVGSDLFLNLGLTQGKSEHLETFLPKQIKPELKQWLLSAIKGGEVTNGSVIYRGSVRKDASEGLRTLQLGFDVDKAELDFHPEWPFLESLNGQVLVDGRHFSGLVERAGFKGSLLENVRFQSRGDLAVTTLNVQGKAISTVPDSISLLNETPLQKAVGNVFRGWSGEGALKAVLDLQIPLYKDAKPDDYRQKVAIAFSDANLDLTEQNIQFDRLRGSLQFDSKDGLSSPWLKASLWGSDVEATVTHDDKHFALLKANTQLSVDMINQWLKQPLLSFYQGQSQFETRLVIPRRNSSKDTPYPELLISSNLEGVESNLPMPFQKEVSSKSDLLISVPLSDGVKEDQGSRSIKLTLDNSAESLLYFRKNKFIGAHVSLGDAGLPSLTSRNLIAVNADLDRLDFLQWKAFLDQYAGKEAEKYGADSLVGTTGDSSSMDWLINAKLKQFVLKDFVIDEVSLLGKREGEDNHDVSPWEFDFSSDLLNGSLFWNEANKYPFELDFREVRIPLVFSDGDLDVDGGSEASLGREQDDFSDPLKDFDLSGLPAARVNIQSVHVGKTDYGSWSFYLKPEDNQVRIHHLTAQVKAMVVGDLNWRANLVARESNSEKSLQRKSKKNTKQGGGTVSSIDIAQIKAIEDTDEFMTLSLPEVVWISDENGMRSVFKGVFSTKNIGDVAKAWGHEEVIKSKRGDFYAEVTWPGSPLNFDIYALQGDMKMTLKRGQFLQNEAKVENPVLRLVGLFNFDSWARRLRLDFSDLYKSGMSYDRMDASLHLEKGVITLASPLKVDTPSSELEMMGVIDMNKETLDAELTATLPVGGNLAMIGAIAGGLPAAIGVYVVSKIFKKQVKKVASVHYSIKGEWDDPKVEYTKLEEKRSKKPSQDSSMLGNQDTDRKEDSKEERPNLKVNADSNPEGVGKTVSQEGKSSPVPESEAH